MNKWMKPGVEAMKRIAAPLLLCAMATGVMWLLTLPLAKPYQFGERLPSYNDVHGYGPKNIPNDDAR